MIQEVCLVRHTGLKPIVTYILCRLNASCTYILKSDTGTVGEPERPSQCSLQFLSEASVSHI